MHKRQHEYLLEYKRSGGQSTFKKKKKPVIDTRDPTLNTSLIIGHDNNQIETVLTTIHSSIDDDNYYVDSPLFKETESNLLDILNLVVFREIVLRAKEVKFVVPVTINHIEEQACPSIVESIERLSALFNNCNYDELLTCVQPVITRVKPTDESFDIDLKQNEITEKLQLVLTKLKHDANRDNDKVK